MLEITPLNYFALSVRRYSRCTIELEVRRMTPKVLVYAKPLMASPSPNVLLAPLEACWGLRGHKGPKMIS